MEEKYEGGCACRTVRYRLASKPMFVNCCHCSWCQRETGSAFVLNALMEAGRVEVLQGTPEVINTPSNSGKGQMIARCPKCHVALWSNYGGLGDLIRFVRVGTLDEPSRFPPNAHIFTRTKQPWFEIPKGTPVFTEYYKSAELWPPKSLERRAKALGKKA